MISYRFICQRGASIAHYDMDLAGDLAARKLAADNQTCVRVETPQGRVVWRKPMTDAEMRELMTRGKLRKGKVNAEPIRRPFAMPGLQGDLSEWLGRDKTK